MRIFKNAWFERFARKQKISDAALTEAVWRAERGRIDADLGGGVIKQRIAQAGQGKSGGYRAIILYAGERRAFFVYGFAKKGRDNIDAYEEAQFKKADKYILTLTEEHLAVLLRNGQFTEVNIDDEEISK